MKHPIMPSSSLVVLFILKLLVYNISVVSCKKPPYINTSIQRIDKVESWLSSSKHQLFVRGGDDNDSDDNEYIDDSSDDSTEAESDGSEEEEISIDSEQQSPSDAITKSTLEDDESSDTEDEEEDILLQQQYYQSHSHHHTNDDDQYYLKRGTRTTGVGAKSKQNQSIFSKKHHYTTNKSYYSKLTSSALSGEILNRKTSKNDITKCHSHGKGEGSKSSMGSSRIWVHQTNSNTIIFKFPRKGKNVYIELSESTPSSGAASNKKENKKRKSEDGRSTVHAKYISNSQLLAKLSTSTSKSTSSSSDSSTTLQFVPIEGIYGIYNLPISGPQLVLITSSEEIYTSPLIPQSQSSDLGELGDIDIDIDNDRGEGGKRGGRNERPLLELRRVKSMEIVSLRSSSKNKQSSDGQLVEEEKRQLKLLRKSFKEHDLYFTPPSSSSRTDDRGSVVVQDVTHSLQRSFLNWMGNSKRSSRQKWWIPYLTQNNDDEEDSTKDRVVDPRFFWNEQPALSLLPPASSSAVNDVKDESPHAMLLDHAIPVTSAFVGIQKNIPIPTTSPSSSSTSQADETNERYDQILISRRSKYRTGTRFTRRGCDDTGSVANYAETEQICFIVRDSVVDSIDKEDDDKDGEDTTKNNRELLEIYSHIQTRGSIPLHWSSPAKVNEYRPRVYIGVDPMVQARGLRDHLLGELAVHSSSPSLTLDEEKKFKSRRRMSKKDDKMTKVAIVNLIDKHGDQGRLGNAFDSILSTVTHESSSVDVDTTTPALGSHSIEHIWYDFHAECKGGRWDRLSLLLDQVTPALNDQGYFCAVPNDDNNDWEIQSLQDGVVRTNCMDCLDRTNVVQSMFGRYVLYHQLHERLGLTKADNGIIRRFRRRRTLPLEYVVGYKQHPLTLPWIEGEESHRYLWADNADAISRLYAGTPALKGDFTRTGKRTKKGAMDDGVNSLTRYYVNNFIDADRQEGMDLLAGNVEFSSSTDDESARVLRNRGFQSSHARLKIEDEDFDSLTDTKGIMLPGDLYKHMTKDESRKKDIIQPWWVSSHINKKEEKKDDIESKKFVLGKKGAVITSIVLLVKAPVISAGIVVAVIASELSNSLKKTEKVVNSEK